MGSIVKWLLLFSFITPFLAKGQAEPFIFHRLTTEDNLTSQNYNYYIFKDSEGWVWISSINGLNRYDGLEVKQYLPIPGDSTSLADGNIQSRFFEDGNGDVWFSTVEAVHRYDRKMDCFEQYRLQGYEKEKEPAYQFLFLDTLKNEIWLRHKRDSLFVLPIDGNRKHQFIGEYPLDAKNRIEKPGSSPHPILVFQDSANLQVFHFSNYRDIPQSYALDGKLTGFVLSSFFLENEERLWLGGNLGLVLFNLKNGDYQLFEEFKGRQVAQINGIAPASGQRLVVATNKNGIFYFDKLNGAYTHQIYRDEEGKVAPFLPAVDNIFIDPDENLWISSPGRGIYFTNLNKKKFGVVLQNYSGQSTDENFVRAMAEDAQGRIWCLTRQGVKVLDEKGNEIPEMAKRIVATESSSDQPYYIYIDKKDIIWACLHSGLYVCTSPEGPFKKMETDPIYNLTDPGFVFFKQLENGKRLATHIKNGIFEVLEYQGGFKLQPLQGLNDGGEPFTWIFEDEEGTLYFCKNTNNISVISRKNDRLGIDTLIPMKAMVNAIIEDKDSNFLWVATDMGLYKLGSANNSFFLKKEETFPIPTLNGLLQDEVGNLWASTTRGLVRYSPVTRKSRIFGLSEGLQSLEFNFWSALKTSKGLFAFGGVNGINLFRSSEIEDIKVEAHPVITNILVNDMPMEDMQCNLTGAHNVSRFQELVFGHKDNTLSFNFAALEYSDPAANRFKFRMNNLEDSLIESSKGFTRYPEIKPGHYQFEVYATNSDGVMSQNPARLGITIKPPWWQTRPFYAGVTILVLGLLYAFYRFRIGQVRKKEEQLRKEAEAKQQLAELRQKEAEAKQQLAETETAVLRLQMNPHFIFNSMNSIHSYILQKDIDTANDYLARFSKLMRMILKYSEQPFIPIADEIELLEQYLKTESMRFEKRFDYSFKVDETLDPDDTLVPTMILQPFVENAVWHGLSDKGEAGHIRISFESKDNMLCCSVEDNGIGRTAASKINSHKRKSHESKALSITERRLQLLGSRGGGESSFNIVDLKDKNGMAAGTKVVIQLPII